MIYSRAHILALLANPEHSITLRVMDGFSNVSTDCSKIRDYETLAKIARDSRDLYKMAYIVIHSHRVIGGVPVYLNIETGEVM